ncbi:MAG: hypothetical protein WC869_00855 [Phycisphaerae bacterium]|jgi:hypothetical protein
MPGGNPYPIEHLAKRFRESKVGRTTFVILHSRTCNRSCDFCYIENMTWAPTPFDDAGIDEVIANAEHPRLGFAGGEPFHDKEAAECFLRTITKWHEKLNGITVLSNMDFWHRYEERVRAVPAPITIITNSRCGKTFKTTGNVRIWNKIFVDEIKDFDYPVGPDYYYFFTLKKPTTHNTMTNFADYDYFELVNLMERLWAGGSWVAVMSPSGFGSIKAHLQSVMNPQLEYINKVVFPVGWKDEIPKLSAICKSCGLQGDACVAAIEANKCPRHHKACFYCSKINECSVTNINEKIVDKWRMPDCSKHIALYDLAREYRAKWVARTGLHDPHDDSPWDFSND